MKSALHRRLAKLERTIARARRSPAEILFDTFSTDIQARMRRTGESFEQAGEAVTAALTLDEMKILLGHLEADNSSDSAGTEEFPPTVLNR